MLKPYYEEERITIYHGDSREIIPKLVHFVDAVITDPPYSAKTHKGHNAVVTGNYGYEKKSVTRESLHYDCWTQEHIETFIALLDNVSSGWICIMTDDILAPSIKAELELCGRYVFAPVPFVHPGSRVRLSGDGPSSWTIWMIMARTAAQARWGTLPGAYVAGKGWQDRRYIGGKPIKLLRALVGDYTRKGQTILDPFMGSGTTLEAARDLGRYAIGIDSDERACELAVNRLRQGVLAV